MAKLIIVVSVGLILACAYYNTFYNARKAFEEGERIRHRQDMPDGSVPPLALASYELAIENAGLVLRDHPGSSLVDDALVLIGDALAIQGQHPQAIERYEQVLRLFPDSEFGEHCLFSLCKSYLGAGDTTRADELLDRFIREYPDGDLSPDAHLLRGEIALWQRPLRGVRFPFRRLHEHASRQRPASGGSVLHRAVQPGNESFCRSAGSLRTGHRSVPDKRR